MTGIFLLNTVDIAVDVFVESVTCLAWEKEGMSCEDGDTRWFGHLERKGESDMTRWMYKSKIDAVGVR